MITAETLAHKIMNNWGETFLDPLYIGNFIFFVSLAKRRYTIKIYGDDETAKIEVMIRKIKWVKEPSDAFKMKLMLVLP